MIEICASRSDSTKVIWRARATEQTLDAKLRYFREWAIDNKAPLSVSVYHPDGVNQHFTFDDKKDGES